MSPNPPGDAVTAAASQLRELIREGRELLKDLRAERRAVEALVAGVRASVEAAVEARIEDAVTRQVAELGNATQKAMQKSVAKVGAEFDRLARIYLGTERQPGGTLEELTRKHLARRLLDRPNSGGN